MQSNPDSASKKGIAQHIAFCFLPLFLFVLLGVGVYLGGWWIALPSVFLVVVIPLLDLVTGWQDDQVFEKSDFTPFQLWLLHWNTRLYALFYMGSVIALAVNIHRFQPYEIGLLISACGLLGGIGFGSAHELLHAKENIDQIIQRFTTSFLFYPHYKLIHIRSHHLNAGTEHDENTAWLNESIYAYIYRTIPGSMVRSWNLEVRRANASGKPKSAWQLMKENQMVTYAIGQVALLLGLFLVAGPGGLLFYIAHILGAHLVLESVNYIQHYGLMRDKNGTEYEKTGPEHSWDTYHYFSSYVTFRVGHHSYHHIAVKPYYLLVAEPEAPKLPVGYFWAIAVIFLPPWWRRIANSRLKPEPAVA